jgi:hypothetical protein
MVADKQTQEDTAKSQETQLNRAVSLINYFISRQQKIWQLRKFWRNMYNSYDELLKNKAPWQTKYAHALPFLVTEMKASFIEEGVFGSNSQGLWSASPWSSESIPIADKITKLLHYQENGSNLMQEDFYLGAKSSFKLGDWFLECYWDYEERVIQQPDQLRFTLDGNIDRPIIQPERGGNRKFAVKNQPNVRSLPVNSVWVDDSVTRWEDQRIYMIRKEIPFSVLKDAEQTTGRYKNVDKVKGTIMPKMDSLFYEEDEYNYFLESRSSALYANNTLNSEEPMVEVIHIVNRRTGEVESIANRSVWLGRVKPFRNLTDSVIHIRNLADESKLLGTSDYQAVVSQWRLINKYQSLEADNLDMHFRGYTKIARDAGPNVLEAMENLAPGSNIVMNNLGAVSHERPDLFSPMVSQSKQELIADTGKVMGLDEILRGSTPSSNIRSSAQFQQLAQYGAKMLSRSIRNVSAGLKKVGEIWLLLNYDYLDPDEIFPVLGNGAVEFEQLAKSEIPPFAKLSVRLAADLDATKDKKLQQLLQAINLAQTNPGIATQEMIKDWFRQQGEFDNIDKYFPLSTEEYQQLARMNVGIQQAQGVANVAQEPSLAGGTQVPSPNQISQGNINAAQAG